MPGPSDLPKPTAAELELLQALWPLGSATARQAHDALRASRPDLGYGAVLRLMQVMHGKGLLIRDDSQRSHVYAPAQPRDALQTSLLKALVLAALKTGLSRKDREEIERLLKEDKQ
jgi:predicted transcriptional regulator